MAEDSRFREAITQVVEGSLRAHKHRRELLGLPGTDIRGQHIVKCIVKCNDAEAIVGTDPLLGLPIRQHSVK